jgi:hypothetical protein
MFRGRRKSRNSRNDWTGELARLQRSRYHRGMSSQQTTEERLTKVEKELAELKRRLSSQKDGKSWVETIAGTFENDPEFEEIVKLGREFRKSAP